MRLRTIAALWALFFMVLAPPPAHAARKGAKAGKTAAAKSSAPQQKSRHTAFWTCSDGKGTVSLFWLPTGGDWPEGGFRLERITKGSATVLAPKLGPGLDASTLMRIPDAQAEEIRAFSDKLTQQTLTEDDQRASIVKMGGTATIDIAYGLALGVRYVDSGRGVGKRSYRLTLMGAEGKSEMTIDSDEVDPLKRTAGPAQAVGLRAKPLIDSVALYWSDPPVDQQAPVVAYMVDRSIGSRKSAATVSLAQAGVPACAPSRAGSSVAGSAAAAHPRRSLRPRWSLLRCRRSCPPLRCFRSWCGQGRSGKRSPLPRDCLRIAPGNRIPSRFQGPCLRIATRRAATESSSRIERDRSERGIARPRIRRRRRCRCSSRRR